MDPYNGLLSSPYRCVVCSIIPYMPKTNTFFYGSNGLLQDTITIRIRGSGIRPKLPQQKIEDNQGLDMPAIT